MTTEELMTEVERLRGVLVRIEALVWYEPDDEDDLVEAVRTMARERDEARRDRDQFAEDVDALAREAIRSRAERDKARSDLARCREVQKATAEGWRHEVAEVAAIVGAPAHTAELAACVRAEVERLRRERDEARAEVARLTKERDAARKSFEEAIESLEESEHEMHLRIRAGYDKTIADSWRAKVAEVEAERDHERTVANEQLARAHDAVRERDEARRDLGAILAVIHRDGGHHTGEHGLSQSVADAHATWASVVRERDEARAEVERLRNADPGPRLSG